jgi:hypothetical protein
LGGGRDRRRRRAYKRARRRKQEDNIITQNHTPKMAQQEPNERHVRIYSDQTRLPRNSKSGDT